MEDLPEVAVIINDALQASAITQSGLARTIGVTQPTVSRWRTGKSVPDPAHYDAIEKALDLAPGTLRAATGITERSMGERLKAAEGEIEVLRGLVAQLLARLPLDDTTP